MHDSHKWDRILNSRTASGRLSWSPGPELQDFPREVRPEVEEVLEKWREAFPGVSRFLVKETGAPEGTGPTFPDIDYAELEMRTLAHSFDHEDPRNIVGDGGALSGLSDDQRAAIAAIQKEFAPARIKPEGRGAPYGFSRKSAAELGATPLLPTPLYAALYGDDFPDPFSIGQTVELLMIEPGDNPYSDLSPSPCVAPEPEVEVFIDDIYVPPRHLRSDSNVVPNPNTLDATNTSTPAWVCRDCGAEGLDKTSFRLVPGEYYYTCPECGSDLVVYRPDIKPIAPEPSAENLKALVSRDDHVNNAVLAAREHLEELAGRRLSDSETYALNDVIATFAHGLGAGEGEE
jgi:hypothetical protein